MRGKIGMIVLVMAVVGVRGDAEVGFDSIGFVDLGIPSSPSVFCPDTKSCARSSLACFRYLISRAGVNMDKYSTLFKADGGAITFTTGTPSADDCAYFPRCPDEYVETPAEECVGNGGTLVDSYSSVEDCLPLPGDLSETSELDRNRNCLRGWTYAMSRVTRGFVASQGVK
mmetsp:Transcript_25150/g.70489  ORF Transcript_25150/g.70489 Transcript_25150/m.70489 type:complete len:171 (+) Transcript_25150:51-563(+)